MNRRVVALAAVLVAAAALAIWAWGARARGPENYVQCASGFVVVGPRCMPSTTCPPPLVKTPRGCDAPAVRVPIPNLEMIVGPGDWEAEGRVASRTVTVRAFDIDAFEVTVGAFDPGATEDLARAASGMTRDAAAAFCEAKRGRLPTGDEWLAAAAGEKAWRYPWGNTGAVCRRAAWGLATGPCATGATGPDTVGAHPEGDTPGAIHDLAGNVAEWVGDVTIDEKNGRFVTSRGGSYASALATDLRTWAVAREGPGTADPRIGFRCAYAAAAVH